MGINYFQLIYYGIRCFKHGKGGVLGDAVCHSFSGLPRAFLILIPLRAARPRSHVSDRVVFVELWATTEPIV